MRFGGSSVVRDFRPESLVLAAFCCLVSVQAFSQSVDITVRRAPYVISSVSSKSEHAWATCKYCGSKTGYERTYKWDVYNHVWVETTKREDVPEVCRKCASRVKEQEKLDREERTLDSKIEQQRTRLRIREKKRELEKLRQEAR